MPKEFPIIYLAEKIASELFDHVMECINVSYLTYILVTDRGVVQSNRQIHFIHSKLNKVYGNKHPQAIAFSTLAFLLYISVVSLGVMESVYVFILLGQCGREPVALCMKAGSCLSSLATFSGE